MALGAVKDPLLSYRGMNEWNGADRTLEGALFLQDAHTVVIHLRKVNGSAVVAHQKLLVRCKAHGRATIGAGH